MFKVNFHYERSVLHILIMNSLSFASVLKLILHGEPKLIHPWIETMAKLKQKRVKIRNTVPFILPEDRSDSNTAPAIYTGMICTEKNSLKAVLHID